MGGDVDTVAVLAVAAPQDISSGGVAGDGFRPKYLVSPTVKLLGKGIAVRWSRLVLSRFRRSRSHVEDRY